MNQGILEVAKQEMVRVNIDVFQKTVHHQNQIKWLYGAASLINGVHGSKKDEVTVGISLLLLSRLICV